ncbi:MAG: hypothetical protein N4A57_08375 [Anaeromicrobium sp.]|jgi:hypothetical protein|uniref:hypothetical protein n=1 Tax=Anaeromicrobium sp. TaxID=1929132 RepID=UPI0025DEC14F|nr:hypothetical protein [Anaeromicrobium sp.]MCT4594268.1 hypothetical protein [Anaeromicrobium sp.]
MAIRIYDNKDYNYTMNEVEDAKWFKVKFDEDGLANFWLRPEDPKHDVNLYVHERESAGSRELGSSTRGVGRDEIIKEIPVEAGRYYYISVENRNNRYGEIIIKARNYPQSSGGSKEFDLGIKDVTTDQAPPFAIGQVVDFNVQVENYEKNDESPEYKVILKDRTGNELDYDNEPSVRPGDTNKASLSTTIRQEDVVDGKAKFKIIVESRDSDYTDSNTRNNEEIVEYTVSGVTSETAREISEDVVYNDDMSESEEGKWYKVKFTKDGNANFWINSAGLSNNLDLFVYTSKDRNSTLLGNSTEFPGVGQPDDIVKGVSVRAGVCYYIYVKNSAGGSCTFKLKAKNHNQVVVGQPTNVKHKVHNDGLGMTITFTPGANSTETIIKNGSELMATVPITENSAKIRFKEYNKAYVLDIIASNGESTSVTKYPVETGSKPIYYDISITSEPIKIIRKNIELQPDDKVFENDVLTFEVRIKNKKNKISPKTIVRLYDKNMNELKTVFVDPIPPNKEESATIEFMVRAEDVGATSVQFNIRAFCTDDKYKDSNFENNKKELIFETGTNISIIDAPGIQLIDKKGNRGTFRIIYGFNNAAVKVKDVTDKDSTKHKFLKIEESGSYIFSRPKDSAQKYVTESKIHIQFDEYNKDYKLQIFGVSGSPENKESKPSDVIHCKTGSFEVSLENIGSDTYINYIKDIETRDGVDVALEKMMQDYRKHVKHFLNGEWIFENDHKANKDRFHGYEKALKEKLILDFTVVAVNPISEVPIFATHKGAYFDVIIRNEKNIDSPKFSIKANDITKGVERRLPPEGTIGIAENCVIKAGETKPFRIKVINHYAGTSRLQFVIEPESAIYSFKPTPIDIINNPLATTVRKRTIEKSAEWAGEKVYETVGWGLAFNFDFVVTTASLMAIKFDTDKFGAGVLEEYKAKNLDYDPDWNKPVVYTASGGTIGPDIFKDATEEFIKFLNNPKTFKFKKQTPSGSATVVQVLKLKSKNDFDPIDVTKVGLALGGNYKLFTANAAKTHDVEVIVVCYGLSTPGMGPTITETKTRMHTKKETDPFFRSLPSVTKQPDFDIFVP